MSQSIVVTVKNIDARIKSWSGRGLAITNEVQDATKVAVEYYAASDDKNALYVTKVMNGVLATKGMNANKYKAYILAMCTCLEYTKNKEGQAIFKTKKKHAKDPAMVDDTLLGTLWAEYKAPNAQVEFDLDKKMKALLKAADGNYTRDQLIAALDKALGEEKGESAPLIAPVPSANSTTSTAVQH